MAVPKELLEAPKSPESASERVARAREKVKGAEMRAPRSGDLDQRTSRRSGLKKTAVVVFVIAIAIISWSFYQQSRWLRQNEEIAKGLRPLRESVKP